MSPPRQRALTVALPGTLLAAALACSVGTGEGSVQSGSLFVDECWRGRFDLRPTFFAANPFADTVTLRIQRGERDIQESDGVTILVNDVPGIRANRLNQELPLGLPLGVTPLGYAPPEVPFTPAASLTLYLNSSCRGQTAELYSVAGTIRFEKLFSGDRNEGTAEDRLTIGSFRAIVVDPRDALPLGQTGGAPASGDAGTAPDAGRLARELPEGLSYTYPEDRMSEIVGTFDFVFHRGTPAQPFP